MADGYLLSFHVNCIVPWIVSYFCCLFSYHKLLELHYGEKQGKSLAAKEWVSEEGLSVRETEWHMDMEMFLDGYAGWGEGSSHQPVILPKIFQYTAEQGQKEVEWMICQGHQHGLPKLDPKADVSAIQLVRPQTSKEEFRALYYKVNKLRRLPGSPLWEPEWMEEIATEIVSSLKGHLGWKGDGPLQRMEEPGLTDIWPLRSKTPVGRRDTSTERSLAKVREPIGRLWPP